ncbi:UNVERIFIED_CONTAM: hypothetical protein NCL1_28477 [Trichonephila clavipes]
MFVFSKYDSFVCASISKTIPKDLKCYKITLTVLAKDLFTPEENFLIYVSSFPFNTPHTRAFVKKDLAAVAEWYRYRTVACFVTGSSPVPLKTRRVGQRCTLNQSRAETSSR